jgi:hypothetical protein
MEAYFTLDKIQMWGPLFLAILDALVHFHVTGFLAVTCLSYFASNDLDYVMFRLEFTLFSLILGLGYNVLISTSNTLTPGAIIYISSLWGFSLIKQKFID